MPRGFVHAHGRALGAQITVTPHGRCCSNVYEYVKSISQAREGHVQLGSSPNDRER